MARNSEYDSDGNKIVIQRVNEDGTFDGHYIPKDGNVRTHFGGNSDGDVTFWADTDRTTGDKVGGSKTFQKETIALAARVATNLPIGDQ